MSDLMDRAVAVFEAASILEPLHAYWKPVEEIEREGRSCVRFLEKPHGIFHGRELGDEDDDEGDALLLVFGDGTVEFVIANQVMGETVVTLAQMQEAHELLSGKEGEDDGGRWIYRGWGFAGVDFSNGKALLVFTDPDYAECSERALIDPETGEIRYFEDEDCEPYM